MLDPNDYLIQGYYFQYLSGAPRRAPEIPPRRGNRIALGRELMAEMFAGGFTREDESDIWSGWMNEPSGRVSLHEIELTEGVLRFRKHYRDDVQSVVTYVFRPDDEAQEQLGAEIWVGRWSGTSRAGPYGSGDANCILRSVPAEFFMPQLQVA